MGFGGIVLMAVFLLFGIAAGYAWRSYYPLALPIESRLVSDKSPDDFSGEDLQAKAARAGARAERAESELDRMRRRVQQLEQEQNRTEKELADMQIKNMLKTESP